ncbi:MAG: DEAD/DEAH box helicase [Nanoarchaeota archaeon]|nr:DEAD/DEAH box helicase [Nanoarchaeota archaeon]
MDELQITFIENKAFIWGFSSDDSKIFTPVDEIEKKYPDILNKNGWKKAEKSIELPVIGNAPIVPVSMKLFYAQYGTSRTSKNNFQIKGIEISDFSLIDELLNSEKRHGILFGGSFDFFRQLSKFAYSLVSMQRFVPYHEKDNPCFIANLDINEDYEIFSCLAKSAPSSIKQDYSINKDSLLRNILDFFVNGIVVKCIQELKLDLKNQTKTDKWLHGLLGNSTKIDDRIRSELKRWLDLRKVNHDLDFNMLFKLTEPEEDCNWALSFNMQSKKDPSLIICLDELWKGSKKIPIKNIRMHLLKDLGIAAKTSMTIEKALYRPNPYEVHISTDEAYNFIINESYLLKDSGFVVHIPKINFSGSRQIKARIKLKQSEKLKIDGTGMLGKALFDFDYSIAIGDIELTKDEFYELSKNKDKLVRVKNKWVELNTADVDRVIKFFDAKKQISIHDTFVINSQQEGFEIDDIIAPAGFEKEINGLFDFKKIKDAQTPHDFNGILRHYQKEGFSWMLHLKQTGFGGILADDMGLGKTIQAIAYILCSKDKPSLVICPTSVIRNWKKEFEIFSPSLKVHIHHGKDRLKEGFIEEDMKKYDAVISSYATIRRDEKIFEQIKFSTIILDEAQNIKNPFTKQAIAINKLKSSLRFCLTGTPIENRLSEFWSIMNFVNPGFLSSWKLFKKNFAEPIELEDNNSKSDLLKRIVMPFLMRRVKTDKSIIDDLPKKTEIKEYCTLTKEQASIYQAIVDDSIEKIESEEDNRRALIMAALIKLKQVCNHPANYLKDSTKLSDRSGKVGRLRELVGVIMENNEKCLIFTQYKEMGSLLKNDLEDIFDTPVCFLHGGLDINAREQMIELFQSDEGHSPSVFILSLKAGGTGINLTKANHVIHFDRWWNPAVENQATDRAFRIGQRKDVFVYKFITSGTIEERIDEMIERKLNLSKQVLSKGEKAITELDNKELKELFALRKESLED